METDVRLVEKGDQDSQISVCRNETSRMDYGLVEPIRIRPIGNEKGRLEMRQVENMNIVKLGMNLVEWIWD